MPTVANLENIFDSLYSRPQTTVEILRTAHGQLHPIAPSAVQELYRTSSLIQPPSLDPSYPQYTQSIAKDVEGRDCTSPLYCLSLEETWGVSIHAYPTDFLEFMPQSAETQHTPLQSSTQIQDRVDPVYNLSDTSGPFSSESPRFCCQTTAVTHKQSEYVSWRFSSMNEELVTAMLLSLPHSAPVPPSISVITQALSVPALVLRASIRSAVSSLGPSCKGVTGTGRLGSVWQVTGHCPLTSPLFFMTGLGENDGTSSFSSAPVNTHVSSGFVPTGVLGSSPQPSSPSAAIAGPSNLPPKVLQSIPPLVATVGFPFHYTIPSRTFVDPEDGTAESLVLDLSFVEGPPVYFGSWVALDGLALHGVPLEVDLKFAPQQLLLVAQDSEGLTASLPLTLDLRRNQADPCHSFSLTVRRSLHSFLLQRHRVELLLSKLLHFFNDSGSHHLAVLSLAPGSTVVSWYNFTLCQVAADGGKGQGPGGQVDAMWEEMSSENGQISPEFSQAMLPEFPISSVGVVRYRHDCFHVLTTIAPVASTSLFIDTRNPTSDYTIPAMDTTTASGQQTDRYHWMARVVTALLNPCEGKDSRDLALRGVCPRSRHGSEGCKTKDAPPVPTRGSPCFPKVVAEHHTSKWRASHSNISPG
ncbi:uncharacterized protein LOC109614952 [Esox lucius]|uniref:uncharacterized protein LOC109614952 n=1 Tax=Esox lucius TaxID=8010 RepID=UPI0014769D2D|nr:uncharacterized protein LOC109614952 [Esox lucius]